MTQDSNRDAAVAQALERTRKELLHFGADELAARCRRHELGEVHDGVLALRFLDRRCSLQLDDLAFAPDIDPLSKVLTLRYLARSAPVSASETPLAYRELPGAAFYVQPFRSRTVIPLAAKMAGDVQRLEQALQRFEARRLPPEAPGDAAWRIPIMGRVWLELHYWGPDEEFPANCELLFAPGVAEIYTADEAAMLGSLLVWGLRG